MGRFGPWHQNPRAGDGRRLGRICLEFMHGSRGLSNHEYRMTVLLRPNGPHGRGVQDFKVQTQRIWGDGAEDARKRHLGPSCTLLSRFWDVLGAQDGAPFRLEIVPSEPKSRLGSDPGVRLH